MVSERIVLYVNWPMTWPSWLDNSFTDVDIWLVLGGRNVLVAGIFDIFNVFSSINFEVIFQLTMLAMIVIAGPAVVLLLAFRGGNL
jgi:Photosystem II complex subunit Ycf12